MQVIDEDHVYTAGDHTYTQEQIGTTSALHCSLTKGRQGPLY